MRLRITEGRGTPPHSRAEDTDYPKSHSLEERTEGRLTRMISFEAMLQHKLLVIHKAEGSLGRAAYLVEVPRWTFTCWLRGTRGVTLPMLRKIDTAYYFAFEKLRLREKSLERRREQRRLKANLDQQPHRD